MAEILGVTAAVLVLCVMLAALLTLSAILKGYVLSVLWGWFAVPLFGLPPIGIPAAIGVALIVGMLSHEHQRQPKSEGKYDAVVELSAVFIRPFVALGIGWIVKRFMG